MVLRKQLWTPLHAVLALAAGCGDVKRNQPDAAPADAASVGPTAIALVTGGVTDVMGSGGNTDADFTDTCPSGQALTGFHGATGPHDGASVVSQLVGHCSNLRVGTPDTNGFTTTATDGGVLPVRGGATALIWTVACPADQFVVGIAGRGGSSVDQIALKCAAVSLTPNGAAWVGQTGPVTVGDPVGGTGGGSTSASCASGQVATTAHVKVVNDVDPNVIGGFGLLCSTIAAQ
jgi:hypothetical protein